MVPTANAWGSRIDTANWMKMVPDKATLNQLSMPGTHEAFTSNIVFDAEKTIKQLENNMLLKLLVKGSIMKCIITALQRAGAQCQDLSITEQLKAGVRYFHCNFKRVEGDDIVYHGNSDGINGVFANCACYNNCDDVNVDGKPQLSLKDVFATMKKYLNQHPSEAIFVEFKNTNGTYDEGNPMTAEEIIEEYGLNEANDGNSTLKFCRSKITYLNGAVQRVDEETFNNYDKLLIKWDKEARKKGFHLLKEEGEVDTYIGGFRWPVQFKRADVVSSLYSIQNGYLCDENGNPVKDGSYNSGNKIFKSSLNIGLKIYGISNNCGECSLLNPIMLPRPQDAKMNKIIEEVVPKLKAPKNGIGYGIIQIDFATKSLCEKIIALNRFIPEVK